MLFLQLRYIMNRRINAEVFEQLLGYNVLGTVYKLGGTGNEQVEEKNLYYERA